MGITESVPMRTMTLSTECDSKLDTHYVAAIERNDYPFRPQKI